MMLDRVAGPWNLAPVQRLAAAVELEHAAVVRAVVAAVIELLTELLWDVDLLDANLLHNWRGVDGLHLLNLHDLLADDLLLDDNLLPDLLLHYHLARTIAEYGGFGGLGNAHQRGENQHQNCD
jgi:hypothetical protein